MKTLKSEFAVVLLSLWFAFAESRGWGLLCRFLGPLGRKKLWCHLIRCCARDKGGTTEIPTTPSPSTLSTTRSTTGSTHLTTFSQSTTPPSSLSTSPASTNSPSSTSTPSETQPPSSLSTSPASTSSPSSTSTPSETQPPTVITCCGDNVQPYTPKNSTELKVAISEYNDDSAAAASKYGRIECWNVALIKNMLMAFFMKANINANLSCWETSQVTNMGAMFNLATSFDGSIGNWNTESVRDMSAVFGGAAAFNQPLTEWRTGSVTSMQSMFDSAALFNQPLSHFDTSNVRDMVGMFHKATRFNQPLLDWNTASVTDFAIMFKGATAFNQDLQWNLGMAKDAREMFMLSGLNQNLCDWGPTINVTKLTSNNGFIQMFFQSQCLNQNDPVGTTGPFCHGC